MLRKKVREAPPANPEMHAIVNKISTQDEIKDAIKLLYDICAHQEDRIEKLEDKNGIKRKAKV